MLVPLDAWEKMLLQLGNLYAAGKDLAEARERAAKAETEAAFLRERLADMRAERDQLHKAAPPPPPPETVAAPEPKPVPQPRWRRIYRAWRG